MLGLGFSRCLKHPPAQTLCLNWDSFHELSLHSEVALLGQSSEMPVTEGFDTCKTCFSYILYIYMFMHLNVFFLCIYIHTLFDSFLLKHLTKKLI